MFVPGTKRSCCCVSWPVAPVAHASSGRVLLFSLSWASYVCVLVLAHEKPIVNRILPNIFTQSTRKTQLFLFVLELHIEFASVPCASLWKTRWITQFFFGQSAYIEPVEFWSCAFLEKRCNQNNLILAYSLTKCNSEQKSVIVAHFWEKCNCNRFSLFEKCVNS
jgi:hypothetical protein